MTKSIDQLRRDAKALKQAYEARDPHAVVRVRNYITKPKGTPLKHADFLHVIALENSFGSWPHLKLSVEISGMDVAAKQQRLGLAIKNGQQWVVQRMLEADPGLPEGTIGLACCFYLKDVVARMLDADPEAATRKAPLAPPLTILAQSKAIHMFPEREADMLAIADMLLAGGADVNAGIPAYVGSDHMLSTLYFAVGHANNMPLARWLLDHSADPNDGESLYHATELGHHEGLRLLLDHGAEPKGTNALLRAMDFHDVAAVKMLIDAGAEVDEFNGEHVGGERPWVVPSMHQAARRMAPVEMVELLLDHGAMSDSLFEGVTPYSMARVYGNRPMAALLEARGAATSLNREETLLARAADGLDSPGEYIDPAKLPQAYQHLIRTLLHLPADDMIGHLRRLVALGVPYDTPDAEGLTPVQIAGWEGLPDIMAYLLTLSPDLGHINGYGGTLLSTILHGSENCPQAANRDHVACLRLALEQGVAIPRRAPELAGVEALSELLHEWAEARPGQVVDGGPV
ncbi:MAG: ankyrin repeat domain-containing protein [Pseudomonadota bacterium]